MRDSLLDYNSIEETYQGKILFISERQLFDYLSLVSIASVVLDRGTSIEPYVKEAMTHLPSGILRRLFGEAYTHNISDAQQPIQAVDLVRILEESEAETMKHLDDKMCIDPDSRRKVVSVLDRKVKAIVCALLEPTLEAEGPSL